MNIKIIYKLHSNFQKNDTDVFRDSNGQYVFLSLFFMYTAEVLGPADPVVPYIILRNQIRGPGLDTRKIPPTVILHNTPPP